MAHDHDHNHDHGDFYLEQLFTIGIGGAIAAVMVMWYVTGKLVLFINPRYHGVVLAGGLGLLALVVIRAVFLWRSVKEPHAVPIHVHDHDHGHGHDHDHGHGHGHGHDHDHDHEHGPGCQHHHDHVHDDVIQAATPGSTDILTHPGEPAGHPVDAAPASHGHDHGHDHAHSHGHDHGHDHAWAPWRYAVLLLPVVLYFLNLPNEGFATSGGPMDWKGLNLTGPVADTGVDFTVGFSQLDMASLTPEGRSDLSGKTVRLVGRFDGSEDKRFSVTRYRQICCAGDARPVRGPVMIDPDPRVKGINPSKYQNKWVQVTGRVQFIPRSSGEYIWILAVYPTAEKPLSQLLETVPQPGDPYVN